MKFVRTVVYRSLGVRAAGHEAPPYGTVPNI